MRKAIDYNQLDEIERLVILDPSILTLELVGTNTPLLYAITNRQFYTLSSVKKLIQLKSPLDGALKAALDFGTSSMVALLLEVGCTIQDDAYQYTQWQSCTRYYEQAKHRFERVKNVLVNGIVERHEKYIPIQQFLMIKQFPLVNDMINIILSLFVQLPLTRYQIQTMLCCKKNHVYHNTHPEGILPIKNRECPICSLDVNQCRFVYPWQKAVSCHLDIFKNVLNECCGNWYQPLSSVPELKNKTINTLTNVELLYILSKFNHCFIQNVDEQCVDLLKKNQLL